MDSLVESSRGIFSICAAAALMGVLAGEDRHARSFRWVCALGATVCVMRMLLRLYNP